MLARRIVAAVGLSLSLSQCTSEGTTEVRTAAIIGGETDETNTNIVGITIQTSRGYASCTGSLILPNLVLTARHCVSELSTEYFACEGFTDPSSGMTLQTTTATTPYPARAFHVTTDTDIDFFNGNFHTVNAVLVPPGSTGTALCGKDIALLRLADPITDVGLRTPRLDLAPTIGEVFTAIGYGAVDGFHRDAGTRRIRGGLNIQFVGTFSQRDIMLTEDSEWLGDTGTCEGDSGGPALDEIGEVIGALSRGGANSCEGPIYTRVDSFATWIRAEARTAVTMGGYDAPAWIAPPAPGTANFGEACRSNEQCVAPLSCRPIEGQLRCTDTGCECPDHWTCGTAAGYPACVPDPNNPEPPDAGPVANDAAATGDAGTGGDGGTGMRSGGCSVNVGVSHASGARVVLGFVGLAIASMVSRRRRRSH